MRKRSLSGLVVAITGGGAGIGAAIAAQTAARGARVAIGDLDKAALEAAIAGVATSVAVYFVPNAAAD